MAWVRAHLRHGAMLALFALAMQVVLSSGHMHVERIDAARTGGTVQSLQTPSQPDGDRHHHPAGVPCDICAVMAMAGTALSATPPAVQLPEAAAFAYQAADARFGPIAAVSGAAQPRGPPLS
jgi:hypothetical protein